METVAPYKEIIDVIKTNGGDNFKRCFQCGLCDVVCPWNRVLVTSCPYCITNFEDSRLNRENSEAIEIKDITEILQEAI